MKLKGKIEEKKNKFIFKIEKNLSEMYIRRVFDLMLKKGEKSIKAHSFENLSVENINIPEGIKIIGSYAFDKCVALKKITLPSTLEKISTCAFRNNGNLQEIEIPNSVTSIEGDAFQNSGLTQIVIPDSVKKIGSGVFKGCINLKKVTLPNTLENIKPALFQQTALENIEIPDSVKIIGQDAFSKCTHLKKVTLPKELYGLGWGAFSFTALENITIPKGVTYIPQDLFLGCSNLEKVEFLGEIQEVDEKFISNIAFSKKMQVKLKMSPYCFKIHSNEWAAEPLSVYLQEINMYISRDGKEVVFSKQRDKNYEKTHMVIDTQSSSAEMYLTNQNYRLNYIKIAQLKENKKIKFFPKDYVLEVFPPSQIENFFINNNHVAYGKLISAMGLDTISDELYKVNALRDFLKIYYAIGGFSPIESERANASNYFEKFLIDNNISIKQGKKLVPSGQVDIQDLALGIHRRFDGIELKGPYNPTFAKFFMKYFHENPNFMRLELTDANGTTFDERDYLCQVHNAFSKILDDNPSMMVNTTSRTLKLTPEFVALASMQIKYENIKPGNLGLAELVGRYGYSQVQFEKMQDIFEEAKVQKKDYVIVADQASEESCVRYRFLEKDDPLGFVIGNITGCCQHLGGAGGSCTVDGFLNPNSGFVVFEEKLFDRDGKPTGQYKLLGQAYVWYNEKKKTVCLDNIEISHNTELQLEMADNAQDRASYATLMQAVQESAEAVMHAMNKDEIKVEKVTTGERYNKLDKQLEEKYGKPQKINLAKAPEGVYSDAEHQQYTILTYDEYTKNQTQKIKNSLQQSQEILTEIASEHTLQNGREN